MLNYLLLFQLINYCHFVGRASGEDACSRHDSGGAAASDPYRSGDELELTQDLDDVAPDDEDDEDADHRRRLKEARQQQLEQQHPQRRRSSRRDGRGGSSRSCEPTPAVPIAAAATSAAVVTDDTASWHLSAADRSEDEVERSSSQEIEVS